MALNGRTFIMLGIGLIIIVGGIWLQIFLSKKDNKFLGLILPTVTFLSSLLSIVNIAASNAMTVLEIFSMIAQTFIIVNIPTIVLLIIYFVCRENIKRKKQLEKMNIQDFG